MKYLFLLALLTLHLGAIAFFPVGFYDACLPSSPDVEQRLARFADAGYNCVLNYALFVEGPEAARHYLDLANKYNLMAIASVKDFYFGSKDFPSCMSNPAQPQVGLVKAILALRDHPALLAWYVNDETPSTRLAELTSNYQLIKSLDPNHPCYSVIMRDQGIERYRLTCDIIGTDPYPIPGQPLSMVTDWTLAATSTGLPAWQVIQAFDTSIIKDRKGRLPNAAEVKCMAYLAVASGAKGIMFWSYHRLMQANGGPQLWEAIKTLPSELKHPAIENGKVQSISVDSGGARIGVRLFEYSGYRYLLVANPNKTSVLLRIRLKTTSVQAPANLIPPTNKDGWLRINLRPYDAGIIRYK
ncbi:MAG: hypothetical protein WCO51_02965 [bacterium]